MWRYLNVSHAAEQIYSIVASEIPRNMAHSPWDIPTRLPAEYRLVLRCARTVVGGEDESHIRALCAAEVDWDAVVRLAIRHRLVPLVFTNLQRLCADAVPHTVLSTLREHFQTNVRRMLLLAVELVRIVRTLRNDGIQALPLKGPVLALYAYGNLTLRQAGDLDILVPTPTLRQAARVLQTLGYYRTWDRDRAWSPAQETAHIHSNNQAPFWCETRRIMVELHWDFAPRRYRFLMELEHVWDRLETLSIAGTPIPTLAYEELLLFLCFHGSKHCWERLSWIGDVSELLQRQPDVNWQQVVARAATLGHQRALALGLVLAHSLFGSALPEAVRQYAQHDPAVPRLFTATLRGLLQVPDGATPRQRKLATFQNLVYTLHFQASIRYKVLLCCDLLVPQVADWQAMPLPRALFPLYYLLRPLRLLRKYLLWWT